MKQEPWKMRYAPHLGFPERDRPWFRETLGSANPVAHIAHIASLGFAGVADKDLLLRPPAEQTAIGEALARHGLHMGSFVDTPLADYLPWASRETGDVALLRAALGRCIEAGRRVGGGYACLTAAEDGKQPPEAQFAGFAENLRWAAELADRAGLRLVIEPTSRARVPGALMRRASQALAVIEASDSPVKMVFDTLHVALEDGDLVGEFAAARDRIAVIQIADTDRFEPGSGRIDLTGFLRAVQAGGFGGLIELEHNHSRPGAEGEAASLAALRALDTAL